MLSLKICWKWMLMEQCCMICTDIKDKEKWNLKPLQIAAGTLGQTSFQARSSFCGHAL